MDRLTEGVVGHWGRGVDSMKEWWETGVGRLTEDSLKEWWETGVGRLTEGVVGDWGG